MIAACRRVIPLNAFPMQSTFLMNPTIELNP